MNLYDVNIHSFSSGTDSVQKTVIAKTPVEAAISFLRDIQDFQEASPQRRKEMERTGEKAFLAETHFELRCFKRTTPYVL